jgi:hypothetical protein
MITEWIFPDNWQILVAALCSVLHQRYAWRLAVLASGIIFAKGRRTVTSWFRCAGLRREIIAKTIFATSGHSRKTRKIVRQFYKLMKLAS